MFGTVTFGRWRRLFLGLRVDGCSWGWGRWGWTYKVKTRMMFQAPGKSVDGIVNSRRESIWTRVQVGWLFCWNWMSNLPRIVGRCAAGKGLRLGATRSSSSSLFGELSWGGIIIWLVQVDWPMAMNQMDIFVFWKATIFSRVWYWEKKRRLLRLWLGTLDLSPAHHISKLLISCQFICYRNSSSEISWLVNQPPPPNVPPPEIRV